MESWILGSFLRSGGISTAGWRNAAIVACLRPVLSSVALRTAKIKSCAVQRCPNVGRIPCGCPSSLECCYLIRQTVQIEPSVITYPAAPVWIWWIRVIQRIARILFRWIRRMGGIRIVRWALKDIIIVSVVLFDTKIEAKAHTVLPESGSVMTLVEYVELTQSFLQDFWLSC